MATKTLTTLASTDSGISMNRAGGNSYAQVEIRSTANSIRGHEQVQLDAAEVLAAIPATVLPNGTTLRAAFLQAYDALHAAALTKGGYA